MAFPRQRPIKETFLKANYLEIPFVVSTTVSSWNMSILFTPVVLEWLSPWCAGQFRLLFMYVYLMCAFYCPIRLACILQNSLNLAMFNLKVQSPIVNSGYPKPKMYLG